MGEPFPGQGLAGLGAAYAPPAAVLAFAEAGGGGARR